MTCIFIKLRDDLDAKSGVRRKCAVAAAGKRADLQLSVLVSDEVCRDVQCPDGDEPLRGVREARVRHPRAVKRKQLGAVVIVERAPARAPLPERRSN